VRGIQDAIASPGTAPATTPLSTREALTALWELVALRRLALGCAFVAFAGYGMATWMAPFLMRVHGMQASEVGLWLGLVSGGSSLAGVFLAGRLSDRLSRRDPRWYGRIPAIGLVLSLPFAALFLLAPLPIALASLVPMGLTVSAWTAPTYAAAHALVDARLRSLVSAVLLFGTNLVGMGAGPQVVGLLSDALAPWYGAESIRWSLLTVHAGIVVSALFYAAAARPLAEKLGR
jgi:MFS family permease